MARKKRDEEEIQAVGKLLPKAPPPEVLEEMKKRQKAQKLVYRCGYYRDPITGIKEKTALVHCTACGETYHLSYSSGKGGDSFGFWDSFDAQSKTTGDCCICPECGAEAEALHISHIKGAFSIQQNYFMTVYNIRGHFVSLSWFLTKQVDKEGRVSWDVKKYEGIALIAGLPVRYTGYISGIFSQWLPEWKPRAVWRDNTDEWDIEEIFMKQEDFDASDASKSGLEEYIIDERKKIRVGAYLKLWSKDPQIENLVRSGFSPIVRQIIEKATTQSGYYYSPRRDFSTVAAEQFFDRKKVKPHEILGIEKAELPIVRGWTLERLSYYKETKAKGIKLTQEQLDSVERFGIQHFRDLFRKSRDNLGFDPPLIRTLNYLVKQRDTVARGIDTGTLYDYWNMTKKIQGSLPPELLYPRDVLRAHDLAVHVLKEKENRETNEKIRKYAEKLSWLSWEDEETGLMIRAAKSQQELISEGKSLSHCVGSYAEAVSRGETAILFIRHIEKPEESFFTLEYRDGRVIQNRGKKNCDRTTEVVVFEAKWIQHIKELLKENNNVKRVRNQVPARQGAGA